MNLNKPLRNLKKPYLLFLDQKDTFIHFTHYVIMPFTAFYLFILLFYPRHRHIYVVVLHYTTPSLTSGVSMKVRHYLGLGISLAMASTATAQLDLAYLYTQTVKTGQSWANINTPIQSLDLKVEINQGIVTTLATFAYTPGKGNTAEYRCDWVEIKNCNSNDTMGCFQNVCGYVNQTELNLDSLETTAYFNVGDNTAVTDMSLWVGETRVKAALQERALASAQYESIVQRRRDPALIESWGNGAYNLRIFPNESGKTRKVQIEFVQGMENEGDLVQTLLPIMHSLAKVSTAYLNPNVPYDSLPNRTVSEVNLEVVVLDGKSYTLNWPGLGSGTVGATPLKKTFKNVQEIQPGTISIAANTCTSCLTPWISDRNATRYFGVKGLLQSKHLEFGNQPLERLFILDINSASNDSVAVNRARKIALLSLKAYAIAPYVANLGFADGKGGINYVFPKSLSMNAVSLRKAYEAIRDWDPVNGSDAETTLRAFAKSRGVDNDSCVLYLINNDTIPYFNYSGNWDEAAQKAYQIFENAQSQKDSALTQVLAQSKSMLFGFWNNYRMSQVADRTGGFQVGTLFGYYYYRYPMPISAVDTLSGSGKPVAVDPFLNLQLPPLFGPGRPSSNSLIQLKVAAKGMEIQNWVVLQNQSYSYMYTRGVGVIMDKKATGSSALAKIQSTKSWFGYGYSNPDSIPLRIAGQFKGSGRVTLLISGVWGGLAFNTEFEVDLGGTSIGNPLGAGLWAYQKSEVLGRDYATDNVKAVQQLGKDYHIVNRQMSLLALEPGMDLWTDMPSKDGTTTTSTKGATSLDMAPENSQTGSIDKITLENILNDFVPILQGIANRKELAQAVKTRILGTKMDLNWVVPEGIANATFSLVNVTGRSQVTLAGKRQGNAFTATLDTPTQGGIYVLIAKAGHYSRRQSIWISGSR
jgi:hypothetical protein